MGIWGRYTGSTSQILPGRSGKVHPSRLLPSFLSHTVNAAVPQARSFSLLDNEFFDK